MDVFDIISELNKLAEEMEIIGKTLELLKNVSIINVQTANRCLSIAHNLTGKAKAITERYEELKETLSEIGKEHGL